jgi:hypothetical protein
VNAHEIASGVVYKDLNLTVTAFTTKRAMKKLWLPLRYVGSQHCGLRCIDSRSDSLFMAGDWPRYVPRFCR